MAKKKEIETERQAVEREINTLRATFSTKEHKLLMRVRDLWAKENRAADSRRRAKDLRDLRSGTLFIQSEGARRLWEAWIVPEFMPENVTELRRVIARLEEFYSNILLTED